MSHPHPELPLPPPLAEGGLRVIALGGLDEIGKNMTVFEHGRQLIVDCGELFPDGPARRRPDPARLPSPQGRFDLKDAAVMTHAHEDHTGALPYLLADASTYR